MATSTLRSIEGIRIHKTTIRYNKAAVMSFALTVGFLSYFLLSRTGVGSASGFALVFLVIIPLAMLASSVISIKQIELSHERGLSLAYIALTVVSLYFIIALALFIVLIGFYALYTFIL